MEISSYLVNTRYNIFSRDYFVFIERHVRHLRWYLIIYVLQFYKTPATQVESFITIWLIFQNRKMLIMHFTSFARRRIFVVKNKSNSTIYELSLMGIGIFPWKMTNDLPNICNSTSIFILFVNDRFLSYIYCGFDTLSGVWVRHIVTWSSFSSHRIVWLISWVKIASI